MFLASVGHVTPHAGAEFYSYMCFFKIHICFMDKSKSSWAVFCPSLALSIFVIGVLFLSATVRV
jgi:hypothetical protein